MIRQRQRLKFLNFSFTQKSSLSYARNYFGPWVSVEETLHKRLMTQHTAIKTGSSWFWQLTLRSDIWPLWQPRPLAETRPLATSTWSHWSQTDRTQLGVRRARRTRTLHLKQWESLYTHPAQSSHTAAVPLNQSDAFFSCFILISCILNYVIRFQYYKFNLTSLT